MTPDSLYMVNKTCIIISILINKIQMDHLIIWINLTWKMNRLLHSISILNNKMTTHMPQAASKCINNKKDHQEMQYLRKDLTITSMFRKFRINLEVILYLGRSSHLTITCKEILINSRRIYQQWWVRMKFLYHTLIPIKMASIDRMQHLEEISVHPQQPMDKIQ